MPFWNSDEKQSFTDESDNVSIRLTDQPYSRDDILICATHGHIYAVHKTTGSDIWDTKFPTGVMGNVISIFITDTDKLIVGGFGKTACMNLLNGQTIWINNMSGFGYESVSVLSSPSKFLSPNKHPNQADELPSYNGQATPDDPVVISCAGGKVMGIDSLTGNTLWTYHCPGGRYRIPTALIEPPSAEEGRARRLVYVGAGKHLYCLRSRTGEVLWTRQISSCMFGYGFMTMATPWSSRLAAEAYTGFNQNPVAQVRDVQRDGEKNSSGG